MLPTEEELDNSMQKFNDIRQVFLFAFLFGWGFLVGWLSFFSSVIYMKNI